MIGFAGLDTAAPTGSDGTRTMASFNDSAFRDAFFSNSPLVLAMSRGDRDDVRNDVFTRNVPRATMLGSYGHSSVGSNGGKGLPFCALPSFSKSQSCEGAALNANEQTMLLDDLESSLCGRAPPRSEFAREPALSSSGSCAPRKRALSREQSQAMRQTMQGREGKLCDQFLSPPASGAKARRRSLETSGFMRMSTEDGFFRSCGVER